MKCPVCKTYTFGDPQTDSIHSANDTVRRFYRCKNQECSHSFETVEIIIPEAGRDRELIDWVCENTTSDFGFVSPSDTFE